MEGRGGVADDERVGKLHGCGDGCHVVRDEILPVASGGAPVTVEAVRSSAPLVVACAASPRSSAMRGAL